MVGHKEQNFLVSYGKKEIADELVRISKLTGNNYVTRKDIEIHGRVHYDTIKRKFGGLISALVFAKLVSETDKKKKYGRVSNRYTLIGVVLMFKNRSKLLFCLLFLAVSSFIFFSVGGEFLHSQVHHHHDQASHDQCFLYQLQVQFLILLLATLIALLLKVTPFFVKTHHTFALQSFGDLPASRAPPCPSYNLS